MDRDLFDAIVGAAGVLLVLAHDSTSDAMLRYKVDNALRSLGLSLPSDSIAASTETQSTGT